MRVGRREFLAGSAAAGAGLMLARWPKAKRDAALAIYDGRSPAGRRFAASARARGVATADIADGETFWHRARIGFGLPAGAALIGVTGWDERVYLAAALRDRGMRVRQESRLDHRMFEWRIA